MNCASRALERSLLIAALGLVAALVVPPIVSAVRGPDPASVAPATSDATAAPGADPAAPRPSELHLAATGAPGAARVTLDERDLGVVTLGEDGGIRGDPLPRLSGLATGLSGAHVSITRDRGVPQALADGLQRLLAYGGALDTVVVEPR